MTREEAIKGLKVLAKDFRGYKPNEEMFDMAIKALEQEPTTKNDLSHNLCNSCTNIGCEFQSGIVRTECVFYMPPHLEPDNCGNYVVQDSTTKNNLAVDKLISDCEKMSFDIDFFNKPLKVVALDAVKNIVNDLPSVTPQEPQSFKWCTNCKEYDQEKHCCHRWSKVIRNTVEEMKQEQEPRKGHWIETAEEYYKAINEKGGGVNESTDYFTDDIACSECLAKFSVIDNEAERFDFCPCCGSDNR